MAKRRSTQFSDPSSTLARARRDRLLREAAAKDSLAEQVATPEPTDEDSSQGSLPGTESTASEWSAFGFPSATLRGLISLAIIVQLFSLLLAFSSNLAPSYLQGRILNVVGPYLHMTHQYYHVLPLELTRAEPLDLPLRIELQAEATGSELGQAATAWQPLALAGLFTKAGARAELRDTRWHNLARWLTLVATADPESEILSDFAAQAVQLAESQSSERYQAVRLLSTKVLSYDEDLALAGNLRDPTDESFQPSVLYSARIVRLDSPGDAGSQRLSLVPAQDALRTAKPIDLSKELP